jgi:AraC-like DNA-binding protein
MDAAKPRSLRTIPSASGGITRLACARLRERGKDVAQILSRAGLTVKAVDDPATRLKAKAQIEVLDLAAAVLGDDLLGLHLARSFDLREIGLVYYVMASSEDLAGALLNVERYSRIVNEGVSLRCTLGQGATIAIDYVDVDRKSDQHHIEFWFVTLVRIFRNITDGRLAPQSLKVRHARPHPSAELKAFFGIDIEFGSDADEIVLSEPVASLPTVRRDHYLNKLLRRYAEEALGSQARHSGIHSEVEHLLPELLPHGRANVPEVARRLGMSPRTLSRKLQDEGVAFTDILDDMRAALAKRYLTDRELPVSEIAWLLGYQEVSSLTHAFKRWSGTTPRQFRDSQNIPRLNGRKKANPGRRRG